MPNPAYSHDGCRGKQQASKRKRSIFAASLGHASGGPIALILKEYGRAQSRRLCRFDLPPAVNYLKVKMVGNQAPKQLKIAS